MYAVEQAEFSIQKVMYIALLTSEARRFFSSLCWSTRKCNRLFLIRISCASAGYWVARLQLRSALVCMERRAWAVNGSLYPVYHLIMGILSPVVFLQPINLQHLSVPCAAQNSQSDEYLLAASWRILIQTINLGVA